MRTSRNLMLKKEQTTFEKVNLLQVAVAELVFIGKIRGRNYTKHLNLGKSQNYKESQSFHTIRLLKQEAK